MSYTRSDATTKGDRAVGQRIVDLEDWRGDDAARDIDCGRGRGAGEQNEVGPGVGGKGRKRNDAPGDRGSGTMPKQVL
jgi:hypothetical protein